MDKEDAVLFLFTIAKEIKRSFESPIILLTLKDYADYIFNFLVDMRAVLLQKALPKQVAEIVNTFHLEWLQAVQDIENFKKRAKDTPRDIILKSIDYTMECVKKRHRYFQRFIEQIQTTMTEEEKNTMQAEIEIIGDMREIVNYALVEKQKHLRYQADKADFYVIIMNEIEELLNWLDSLNDHLAIQISKVLEFKIPLLPGDLVKTLQQIVDEVANNPSLEAQEAAKELSSKDKKLCSAVQVNTLHGLDITNIVEKIKHLEDRINRLKIEDSSAVVALEHKTMYLEERLQSLENLKLSLNCLKIQRSHIREDGTVDEDELHIFNHLLPHPERCRLVEQLVKLWNCSIGGDRSRKSIISILSAADIKEVFSDDLGHFTVDKYGRKIYTMEGDEKLYQLNEQNELVCVKDDDKHVYFYDECGRYYLNDIRERVYKAHATASEYLLHRAGFMLKVSELEDGIEYRYDHLGRYYIDEAGVRIYKDKESDEEYQHDGLGNLVRIRNDFPVYNICPPEPIVTEESKYLKNTIGAALKQCLAEVVVAQPLDPIMYLADRLDKYQQSIDIRQRLLAEREEMMAERENRKEEEPKPPSFTVCEPEESMTDFNFTDYETIILD